MKLKQTTIVTRRWQLGLTDFERNRMEDARRVRNCLWLIAACLWLIGMFTITK